MELTNHIVVNMLKRQLLDIYEKYTQSPELLRDPIIKTAYDLLVKVKTVDDFRQWREAVHDMDLSFDSINGIERQDNTIGILDDISVGADDNVLRVFVKWKLGITPNTWGQTRMLNRMAVSKIKKAVAESIYDHIVIFRCGDQWAAIGDDADRIFELFGWQTGYVNDDDDFISWMFISKYGKEVLENSEYDVKVIYVGDIDVVSVAFTEDMIAAVQQYVDYIRFVTDKANKVLKVFEDETGFIMDNAAYIEQDALDSFIVSKERIVASLKDGRKVTVTEGKDWRLDGVGVPFMLQLRNTLEKE